MFVFRLVSLRSVTSFIARSVLLVRLTIRITSHRLVIHYVRTYVRTLTYARARARSHGGECPGPSRGHDDGLEGLFSLHLPLFPGLKLLRPVSTLGRPVLALKHTNIPF